MIVTELAPLVVAAADLDRAVGRAADALAALQRPDGHWVFELEADATIPAEYILLRHYLGEAIDADLEARIGRYLRRIQGSRDGWGLYHDGAFDISASVKAYFALKMIGDDIAADHMARARTAILRAGGAAAVNVFTRIQLALFAAGPWRTIPTMPPELILAPRWFPVRLSKMAYWARTVIVPLLVLGALKPVARNPRGVRVDELYLPKATVKPKSNVAGAKRVWQVAFGALDVVLKAGDRLWPKRLRARAVRRCVAFVVERLNGDDGLGAIYPAMANSVMMFDALGDTAHRDIARAAVEKLIVRREDGEIYCQPCLSPVWDTALAAHAMLEVRSPGAEAAADAGLDWLIPRQVLDVKGDWADNAPDLRPGGWAFQYENAFYPDLDDTAAVVCALDRARGRVGAKYDAAIARGTEWTVGLQSKDGGWGAFDADNSYHYLNNIPFADHGALLDPPTADVSARVVSMLAQLGEPAGSDRMRAAVAYLVKEQEADGSWFGRWGVNYIYGTWSALCALNAAGLTESDAGAARRRLAGGDPEPRRRLGRKLRQLRARPHRPRPRRQPRVADGVGAARPDGGGAGRRSGGGARRCVADRYPRRRRRLARGALHRRRLPARVLPALPWLCEDLPAVGAGAVPQPARRQHDDRELGPLILLTCGFVVEAKTAASSDIHAVPGGGDATYLAAELDRLAPHAEAIVSWGLTGALRDDLRVGDWVIGTGVSGGFDHDCDADWQERVAAALPGAHRGRFHADGLLADAPAKRALGAGGAVAVDMESHIAARVAAAHELPFAILRVVSDRVDDEMPPAVLVSMGPNGRTDYVRVAASLARHPAQIPAFSAFARHSMACLKVLREGRVRLGPRLSAPLHKADGDHRPFPMSKG